MEYKLDTTVNKLIILFVLEKMEIPLIENSILDICTSRNNWINYMECKDILAQLLEASFIYCPDVGNDDEKRYTITYEGRNCLSHFYQRIPMSLREEMTEFIKNNRFNFKRIQEYTSEYHKNLDDGSYTVTLKIKEPIENQCMFELKMKVFDRACAISTCKKWQNKAPITYETIYENLIESDDNEEN